MTCRSNPRGTPARVDAVRVLPWGEEIYLEIPLHQRGSQHKFYARRGRTADGRDYIEFSKFGILEGSENETYSNKVRFYGEDWRAFLSVSRELIESM